MLQCARANGRDWDEGTCRAEAQGGHLAVLQSINILVGTDKRLWVGHRAVLCSGVRQTPGHAAVVAGERLPLEAT